MAATRQEWEAQFGTGLRTEYDFTIHAATFGTDLAYNNGQTYLLILTGTDQDGSESTEMLSLGDGWESKDGGFTVEHERKAQVNKNSAYGKWCAFAAQAVEEAKQTWLFERNPLEAATWADSKWHLEERETSAAWVDKAGKEVAARSRLVPVTFLGFDGEVAKTSSKPSADQKRAELLAKAEKASAATQAAPAVASSNGNGSVDPALIQLAKEHDDFKTFVNAALQFPDVLLDEQLSESIVDGGASGFYATHHG